MPRPPCRDLIRFRPPSPFTLPTLSDVIPISRLLAASATLALLTTVAACSTEVAVSSPSASPAGASVSSSPDASDADLNANLNADLNAEPNTVGALTIRLPLGWAPVEGTDMAAPGADSVVDGGSRFLAVPTEGRSVDQWKAALLDGTANLVVEREGLEEQEPIRTASGLEVFHLVHTYSDNRAHLFGTVVGQTLHLVRFGLDGSESSATVVRHALTTLSVAS